MKFFKKFFALAVFILAVGIPTAAYARDITVTVDGVQVNFAGQAPTIIASRTLVPVRGVFEALGFNVSWDGVERAATLARDDFTVVITIDSETFTLNGAVRPLEVPAQIIGGRTMLPLRAVIESVGYSVRWDADTQTVLVSTGFAP